MFTMADELFLMATIALFSSRGFSEIYDIVVNVGEIAAAICASSVTKAMLHIRL